MCELDEDITECLDTVSRYEEAIDEDIAKREQLVALLTEALEKQETQLSKSKQNKTVCAQKVASLTKLKEALKVY